MFHKLGNIFCVCLFFVVEANAQQRVDGVLKPLQDGEVRIFEAQIVTGTSSQLQPKLVEGAANSDYIRVGLQLDTRETPDFLLHINDLNGTEIARYAKKDLLIDVPTWTVPIQGSAAYVSVVPTVADPGTVSILLHGVSSHRAPESPFLSIIEPNDLESMASIRNDRPEIYSAGQSVARLSIIKKNGAFVCTGFMIDEERMITNEHCVNQEQHCRNTSALFGYHSKNSTVPSSEEVQCVELIGADPDLDVALLRLKRRPGERWGALTLASDTPALNEPAVIIQHPGGQIKQISRRDCTVRTFPADGSAKDTDFGHKCDTMGGSSGSPVLRRKDLQVIGLHHWGIDSEDPRWSNENRAVRMEKVIEKVRIWTQVR
jgi:V8-like Glu-specific endopeptidase